MAVGIVGPDLSEPVGAPTGVPTGKERTSSLWGDAWRQLIRKPTFVVPALFILVMVSMAIFPTLWTSQDPGACTVTRSRLMPSAEHIFGTDVLGCDYFSHAIYGARPSLQIAVGATIGIVLVGGLLGLLAGFFGGWVDAIISRITDIFLGLPFLLGAIVFLIVIKKQNVWTITAILIILGWTTVSRVLRGNVIASKGLDYVQAAKAMGASDGRIMFKHILPNAIAPVLVIATIALGAFVAAEATLSFLGVGLIPPQVSWGIMIASNQDYYDQFPLLLLFPCLFLVGTVLSFVLIGDALRDALDPKLR
jgi:peptide/nickel transport system permease protein/oligopeptide transport system permease protein